MLQDVPFDLPAGQPPLVVVQAKASGKPLAMLIDTGNAAPFTLLLTPEAAARLKGETPAAPPAPTVVTTTGGPPPPPPPMTFTAQPLRKFRLGPVRLKNVQAGVSPAIGIVAQHLGRPVDGILGYGFFKGRRIRIDYAAKRIDLDARVPEAPPENFSLAPASPLALVRVMLNGHGPYTFALDTGASATLVSKRIAKDAGLGEGEKANIAGVGGAQAGGVRLVQAPLALGGYARDGRNVAITGSLAPLSAASGAQIDGVLGADFFAGARLTIDYGQNHLWIEAPPPGQ